MTKFISTLMSDGKRNTAEKIMYASLRSIQEKTGDDPLKVFKKAVENVKPALEVKSRRVGGSNYQVPVEVNPNRRLSLSIRWLVGYARERGDGKTMQEKLANELARWGASRICPLGKMQSPPLTWRHDGRPSLGDLVMWTDWEQ